MYILIETKSHGGFKRKEKFKSLLALRERMQSWDFEEKPDLRSIEKALNVYCYDYQSYTYKLTKSLNKYLNFC